MVFCGKYCWLVLPEKIAYCKDRHSLGDMLKDMKRREAALCVRLYTQGPFMCMCVVHGCAVPGTVCKNSTHLQTWKIRSFCPFFMTHEFKPAKFYGLNFAPTTELFYKTKHVTRGKLLLQHVLSMSSQHVPKCMLTLMYWEAFFYCSKHCTSINTCVAYLVISSQLSYTALKIAQCNSSCIHINVNN